MTLPNPYTPGQLPRVLAGRDAERARIRGHLTRIEAYGEIGGPLLAFYGPRGVGKTSLLRAAEQDARAQGFVSVWVAATPRGKLLAELARATERALEAAETKGPAGRAWRGRIEEIKVEVGVPGAKVGASVTADRQQEPEGSAQAPIGAVHDLLHDAARLVRDSGGAGLLLFIDEVHAAPRRDLAVLLNALQILDGRREENPLAMFVAGLPSTPEAITRAATFGERSTFLPLSRLDEADSVRALVDPAAALEVSWEADALRALTGTADGYPYFLQLLGATTWDAAAPRSGSRLTLADVQAGREPALQQLRALYRARWKAASPLEQDIMVAMAGSAEPEVRRSFIAAQLGRDTRELSVPRDRLIEKGIVEPIGRGLLRFTLPGFAAYIAEEADLPAGQGPARGLLELPE